MANGQDKHLEKGKCPEKPVRCGPSHGYEVCASKEKEDGSDIINLDDKKTTNKASKKKTKAKVIKYGGSECVNGVWDNKCLEFCGVYIKYAAFDDSLADDFKRFKKNKIIMKEGRCALRGYDSCRHTNLSTDGVNGIKAYKCYHS